MCVKRSPTCRISLARRCSAQQDHNLIAPSQPDGSGVDAVVATVSAGPAVKTVVVGLLSDVSLESARRFAESTTAGCGERWIFPIIADPTSKWIVSPVPDRTWCCYTVEHDGGASRSIQKMLEAVGLACYLMPQEKRPMVLYAGNHKLGSDVQELLGGHAESRRSDTMCVHRLKRRSGACKP